MKKNKIYTFLFIFLLLGSIFLRFFKISNFPPSLNWDEVSHGYNAYSILKTGYDEWGKLPIFNFRAYGDYPLPLNLYITIPSIAVFGLNEFSIRLPHMILGILTIISVYFLALGISKDKRVGILAGFLVAISPWYFFTSRVVFQSNLSIFLLTSSMALFVNRRKYKYFLPLSFLLVLLTLFSYHSTRIFSPLLLIGIIYFYRNNLLKLVKQKKSEGILALIVVLTIFVLIPIIFLNPESSARSQWVFIINEGAVNKIIELRQASKLPESITRIIFNRPTYFVKEFLINYFGYFSPKYLFLKGGTQYQFSLQNHGLLYIINLPFFYFGIILLIKKAFGKGTVWKVILFWLVISPIPAAITSERFAVLRSTTMLPIPEILISIFLFYLYDLILNRKIKTILLSIYLVFLLMGFVNYYFKLVNKYPFEYSNSWQYGYEQVSNFIKDNYQKYDKIVVTKKYGEPHEFLLFFLKWNPNDYRNDKNLVRFYQSGWWWVDSFDKFYFVNDWDIPKEDDEFILESKNKIDCKEIKCLLITESDKYPFGWKKITSYNFLDGKEAFGLYEN